MQRLISMFIIFLLVNSVFADCNWQTDVVQEGDKFIYTASCHNKVGLMVDDLKDYELQVTELRKTIEYKDLVIQKADERIDLWREQTYNQHDRLQKAYNWQATENKWYFISGFAVAILSVWASGQLKN